MHYRSTYSRGQAPDDNIPLYARTRVVVADVDIPILLRSTQYSVLPVRSKHQFSFWESVMKDDTYLVQNLNGEPFMPR